MWYLLWSGLGLLLLASQVEATGRRSSYTGLLGTPAETRTDCHWTTLGWQCTAQDVPATPGAIERLFFQQPSQVIYVVPAPTALVAVSAIAPTTPEEFLFALDQESQRRGAGPLSDDRLRTLSAYLNTPDIRQALQAGRMDPARFFEATNLGRLRATTRQPTTAPSQTSGKKFCPVDGEVYPDTINYCPEHGVELRPLHE